MTKVKKERRMLIQANKGKLVDGDSLQFMYAKRLTRAAKRDT